jgi:hypothetical protein
MCVRSQLARTSGLRLNVAMRGRAVLVLSGLTAFGAYSVGRQGVPVSNAPVAAATSPSVSVKPVAFIASAAQAPAPVASSGPASAPNADSPERAAAPDTKVETALTAAAIIVQASRDQYHAGGRPCACPDDMRNGRACGGRSAYSRPGGASPLCYRQESRASSASSRRDVRREV